MVSLRAAPLLCALLRARVRRARDGTGARVQYVAWWVGTRAQYVRGWVHTSRHRCARVYSTWVGTLRDGAGVYVYSAYVGGWVGRYVTFLRSASTTRHSSAMPGRCRPPNPGQPRHTGAVYNTRELTCERAHAPNACPPTHARTHARTAHARTAQARDAEFVATLPFHGASAAALYLPIRVASRLGI